MDESNGVSIGLDVSKDSHAVAVAEGGRIGDVRSYGDRGGPCLRAAVLAQAEASGHEPAVLLRGWTDRLRPEATDRGARA